MEDDNTIWKKLGEYNYLNFLLSADNLTLVHEDERDMQLSLHTLSQLVKSCA